MHLETVAPTDSTVLICGETGTGKELVARAVHNLSGRRANAFVKCNCAAIPTGLLESDIWPRTRGVYRRDRATYRAIRARPSWHIFLDEIGETPSNCSQSYSVSSGA